MLEPNTPRGRLTIRAPYVLFAAFLLGILVGLLLARFWLLAPEPLVLEIPTPAPLPATATPAPIKVYVSGAVATPGVYTLNPDSRLEDVVARAGGFTADADSGAINLAESLSDGQHVHVPAKGEQGKRRSSARTPTPAVTFPVDVNRADQKVLEAIPGVGPAMAKRIIAGRPYGRVNDLLRVKGIGNATLEKLRPYVTVGE